MSNRIKIIAEAGCNHNGNFDEAIRLINVAKEAGADSVKFQIIFQKICTHHMFLKMELK